MRALAGELLLIAWDLGIEEHDLNRSLTLLSLALPERSRQEIAKLPLAARNLHLLRLRELSFGSVLRAFATCSQCSAHIEFELSVTALIEQVNASRTGDAISWSDRDTHYRMRQANTEDLLAMLHTPGLEEAHATLLERCITRTGGALDTTPVTAIPGITEKFDELHTATEMSCQIQCPECSSSQMLDLDIARFLWLEVRTAARRLLAEIHSLAWAYGWSERTIARMSRTRRNAYLEMLT